MPSWKKVIISGSDAALNSLDITGDLTVDTNTLYVDSADNRVGIGTTSPSEILHVNSSTDPTILISNGGGTSPSPRLTLYRQAGVSADIIYDVANKNLVFQNDYTTADTSGNIYFNTRGSNNRLTITGAGNVGIGTSSPSQKLTVEGDITGSGYVKGSTLYALDDVVVGDQILHYGDTDTNLSFTTDKIQINAGGVEMITLTEGAADNVHINAGAVDMDFKVSTDNDNDALFVEGSTDRVGIGTGTPSAKLDVNGSINTSGTYDINGNVFAQISSGDFIVADAGLISNNAAGYTILRAGGTQRIYIDNFASTIDITGSLNVGNGTDINLVGGGNLETNGGNVNTTGGSINIGGGAVNGTIPGSNVTVDVVTATIKNFVIDHPSPEKQGYKLRYSSLEGPEAGVYFRGKSTESIIDLPDYWVDLVDEDSITVSLTSFGSPCQHYIEDIRDNQVIIGCACGTPNYHFTVYGERKDVEKLVVEYKEEKYL